MTGRGLDQIMPHPSKPILYESYTASALDYVRLAEAAHGKIPRRVSPSYIWGVALDELARRQPDLRIINLETSITRSTNYVRKGINYRMSPENAACLSAAYVDCCTLANNHVLDWGRAGLLETLDCLTRLGVKMAGAGRDIDEARSPAILEPQPKVRVLVFSFATPTSGVPASWAAHSDSPGVNLLPDLSARTATRVAEEICRTKKPHDIVIASIHWGSNWGYEIPGDQRQFAHTLVDEASISIIHGHSSHHAKAIEVYRNRLILYGCGDFLNDYEGISGYESFRGDLPLMYFADIDTAHGDLQALEITPLHIKHFRLERASDDDAAELGGILDRECARFNARVSTRSDRTFGLRWPTAHI